MMCVGFLHGMGWDGLVADLKLGEGGVSEGVST